MHYAPVEGKSNAEEHYKILTAASASIPKNNVLLVVGDFNACIGKNHGKYTFHNESNKNGQLAIDFAEEANMLITNTHFQKEKRKLWTFISKMSGVNIQLDYITIRRK